MDLGLSCFEVGTYYGFFYGRVTQYCLTRSQLGVFEEEWLRTMSFHCADSNHQLKISWSMIRMTCQG